MSVAKGRPLHPTGIVARFAAGVVVIALLFAFLAVYTTGQLDQARDTVETIIETEHPRSAAAFELEINTLGTGLAVVKYLRQPDPVHKARIEKDSADFESFLEAYRAVAQSERERALLNEIAARYGEFHRLGNAIIDAKDEEVAGIEAIVEPLRELEDAIENGFLFRIDGSGRDDSRQRELARIVEDGIETILDMLGQVAVSAGSVSAADIDENRSEIGAAMASLAALEVDAEQAESVAQARYALESAIPVLARIMESKRIISENFDRLIILRDDLDVLLDEHIQALVAEDLARAHAQADSSISAAAAAVAYGAAGLSAVLLLAIVSLTRVVVVPLRRTAETATAFGRGEFGRRVPVAGRDEFATLARAFNAMADSVQQAHRELETANAKLAQTVGEFRDFTTAASDWYWETGPDGRFTHISEHFFQTMKVAPESIIGKTRREFVSDSEWAANPEKWRRHFEDLEAHRPFRNLEYAIVGVDGEERVLKVNGVPVFDSTGRFQGYRGADIDITERKAAEAALRRAHDELEHRVKERTRELEQATEERLAVGDDLRRKQAELAHVHRLNTASEVAIAFIHEISQPLSAIGAYAAGGMEQLRSGTAAPEDLRAVLSHILAQGTHAKDVLGLIRTQMQQSEPSETSIDMAGVIADTAQLLDLELRRHGVEITLDLADGLPNVRGDAIQVEQVLTNLALNAIEAMSGTGAPTKRLRITTSRAGADAVEIAVADNGPGIDPARIEKVIEPFYTTKEDGMGMGLAISRSIIEAMGGRVWATSDGVSGTTFHVRLPMET